MTYKDAFRHQVVLDDPGNECLHGGDVVLDRPGSELQVTLSHAFAERRRVHHHYVDTRTVADVPVDLAHESFGRESVRLTRFRHQVGDVYEPGPGRSDGLANALCEKVWHEAGVQVSGRQDDEVCLRYGIKYRRERIRRRGKEDVVDLDSVLAAARIDQRLFLKLATIGKHGVQV